MGRAPCCDKANVKRGPWSPEEDAKLKAYIDQHGTGGNWIALPQKIGLKRCGKSCRLRWLNYLRPNIKHGGFSEEEDNLICSFYMSIGSRWSIIAAQLPGRTDNDIKNYWNTRLKKKLLGKQRKEQQVRRASYAKQEIKKESGQNFMSPEAMNLYPYWPELPPTSSLVNPDQEPYIKDQASIRSLLVKLGGKFSNDYSFDQQRNTTFSYPCDISSPQDLLYGSLMNPIDSTTFSQFPNSTLNDFQGYNNFLAELDNVFSSNPAQLHQLESFSGVTSAENSWEDMSSVALRSKEYEAMVKKTDQVYT
ncbi:hypothetical protein RJ639_039205 [Escallonia herrerae]|uniref:Uncharacterized protein n=1 Tax=Escallonia herrerae TaxID=1293975 RepID=A0AA89B8E9_9ASTE|nr:hypothetical protein RJ639_025073 [Escallonia herrerae]KAK3030448.1 hypothetical protein RJ639_039205 [Escallonia herrerae]